MAVSIKTDELKNDVKTDFYSLSAIKAKNAVYNVIIGERSNGKTYAALLEGITNYFEDGSEMAILRRWQEDIRGRRASAMFNALVENQEVAKASGGEYDGITYFAGRFYFCTYDEAGKPLYNDSDVFAHAFALSDVEHNKSISHPRVKTIVFDEFMTRGTYLKDEFVIFMNTLSTIIRQRTDVKVYMLGNTVSKYSPYFKEMGLNHITKMIQGTIDIYSYGDSKLKVAVEYTASSKATQESNFYFAFDNPSLQMITDGTWELDLYPHLPVSYAPKDILLSYFIKFDGSIYQANIIDLKGEMFTYIHDKSTEIKDEDEDIIYSLEYDHRYNWQRSIHKPVHELGKKIKFFFDSDKVFYQDNDVGDSVNNYLKVSRQL